MGKTTEVKGAKGRTCCVKVTALEKAHRIPVARKRETCEVRHRRARGGMSMRIRVKPEYLEVKKLRKVQGEEMCE